MWQWLQLLGLLLHRSARSRLGNIAIQKKRPLFFFDVRSTANFMIQNGDVIFWESLSTHSIKKARRYNKRVADPFARLRVPKYQKAFQVLFFVSFLLLYYAVLVERNPQHITVTEVFLYLWIIAYAYDEFGEFLDAGLKFYQTDFWSLWDLAIIAIGAAFLITSKYTRNLRTRPECCT